nr:immunoglobulin light chain junction region [Macaca mulatta]
CMQGRKHPYSF